MLVLAGITLKLKTLAQLFQVSIHVHPCHPFQQTTENGFNS